MSTKKSTKTARNKNKKPASAGKKQNNNGSSSFKKGLTMGSTASSYEISMRNPTNFNIKTGVSKFHSEYGLGIRVEGRQQLCLVYTTNANNYIFSSGVASVGANYVYVLPYNLNDRIALFSSMYQRYVFRRIRLTYITRVATTQVGGMVLAYNTDGGALVASTDVAVTYSTLQDIQPCVVFPFRKETEYLDVTYDGERTWMVAYDVNTYAGPEAARQCIQGIIQGFPDLTSIGNIQQGEIFIDYELDLYGPTNINTNITYSLFGIDPEVRKILALVVKKSKDMTVENRKVFNSKFKEILIRSMSDNL